MTATKNTRRILYGLLLASLSADAIAAGFQIQEQNARNLGTAYAGTGAMAQDASSSFYNLAGITHTESQRFAFSAVGIFANTDLTINSATHSGGGAVTTNLDDSPGGSAVVPGLYYTARINDKWFFAFDIASPFGLQTEYSTSRAARYTATKSALKTVDISPGLAYRFDDHWSFGAALDVMFADADLEARTGVGAVDGYQKNHADDWATGYHLAALYDYDENTRVGLQYRSVINLNAKGERESLGIGGGPYTIDAVHSSITLPETFLLSAYHRVNDCWSIMGDVLWTGWSRFKTLILEYPATSTLLITPEDWHDTVRVALGGQYDHGQKWSYRFGIAYDNTPTNDENRTARIPDEDRWWFAVGLQYNITPHMAIDVGYDYLLFDDADVSDSSPLTQAGAPASGTTLNGDYESDVHIFGIQFSWNFA